MSGASNPVMNIDPSEEDQAKLAEFEQKIASGMLIEPGDWMPEAYRSGMPRDRKARREPAGWFKRIKRCG